ncbi:MAG: DNA-binding response regulator [Candidatus Omnitrophica bacterium CG07_land_8_20_14_0_80_42_15]|uniref:DNA-binding response regulator n=1 Tax=Candidatus Aquitaenariimonas noxiae TaxID=1974741 RepID=A0A2J0KYR1_9BACT|nr:MAG: DNA-binding response regulator [Candidatus Omnitrophica bacterium CG07_land_8_20_14_0_80_42_15]
MSIEVMLVDDHTIVRQGIKSVISQEPDIKVVAEASDGREAIELAKQKSPDVIVMDISLPFLNGLDASRQILKQNKSIKILILSMHENRVFIEKALSYGIRGYVLKESAVTDIVKAIREVNSGRYFLDSKISTFVIQDYADKKKAVQLRSTSTLTDREREILQLIAEGLSNKEIAQKLKISLKTALVHRNNIMQKLDIHNQAQLIRFALKEGISTL